MPACMLPFNKLITCLPVRSCIVRRTWEGCCNVKVMVFTLLKGLGVVCSFALIRRADDVVTTICGTLLPVSFEFHSKRPWVVCWFFNTKALSDTQKSAKRTCSSRSTASLPRYTPHFDDCIRHRCAIGRYLCDCKTTAPRHR